jgi:hypothetical protein
MRLPHTDFNQLNRYLSSINRTIAISPRELFSMIFHGGDGDEMINVRFEDDYEMHRFFKMQFDLLVAQYNGVVIGNYESDGGFVIEDSDMFINTHLYKPFSLGIDPETNMLERNLEYAPFFLSYWQDQPMIGYVWERNYKQVYKVGYLDDNRWVDKRPKPTLEQNDGKGWYSDRLILFPMPPAYLVLNYPEGI